MSTRFRVDKHEQRRLANIKRERALRRKMRQELRRTKREDWEYSAALRKREDLWS